MDFEFQSIGTREPVMLRGSVRYRTFMKRKSEERFTNTALYERLIV